MKENTRIPKFDVTKLKTINEFRDAQPVPVNKCEILQLVLDKIEPGWHIKNRDTECIFEYVNGDREVHIVIENSALDAGRLEEIERLVTFAVKSVK